MKGGGRVGRFPLSPEDGDVTATLNKRKGKRAIEQHVLSKWLLKAFSEHRQGERLMTVFDKATGVFSVEDPDKFLIERDAHSPEVESAFAAIEGPAARAARNLAKRVKNLPPGMYAVVGPDSAVKAVGPTLSHEGFFAGTKIMVGSYEVPSPSESDRVALARYAGLMYQRAPKNEAANARFGVAYGEGAQAGMDQFFPGVRSHVSDVLAQRRERMVDRAMNIGARLERAPWWVVRADPAHSFVLGDTPVGATLSLGHDDAWHAIFADEAYVVVMPLSPAFALLFATRVVIPFSGTEMDLGSLTRAINRMVWRQADRYTMGPARAQLERAWPDDLDGRTALQDVTFDAAWAWDAGWGAVAAINQEIVLFPAIWPRWPMWSGCRLDFGAPRRWDVWGSFTRGRQTGTLTRGPAKLTASPSNTS